MKRLVAGSLAMTLAATGALAQALTTSDAADDRPTTSAQMVSMQDELIRTRDITGGDVYSMGGADAMGWDDQARYDSIDDGWTDIGEIEDLVLDHGGRLIGVVAEIGGFLDIGDKHVMLPLGDVRLVAPGDDARYAMVTRMTEEQIETLEGVDEGFWE
jgi:hypothetical protein